MLPPLPTELLHTLLKEHVSPGDLAIDATAGNGHDTLFLADAVGPAGKVIAIDIQEKAISTTRKKLEEADLIGRVILHLGSHVNLREIAGGAEASTIIFNLGYLPGGSRDIVTRMEDTLAALESAVRVLQPGGILAVVCYPGHPGGEAESIAVEDFISSNRELRTARYGLIAKGKPAPFLLLSSKER